MERPKNWLHDRSSFFKYLSPDAILKVLKSRSLRWSSPDSFNDPFDMRFDIRVDFNASKLTERTLDALWDAHYSAVGIPVGNTFGQLIRSCREIFPKLTREQFEREFKGPIEESLRRLPTIVENTNPAFRSAMKHTKVLCLSERHDSILMWSHYAQMHRGAVLELACVPEPDSAWGAAMPVRYGDIPSIFDEDSLFRVLSGQTSMTDAQFIDDSINRFVTAKATDWSYESEWRVVLHLTDPNKLTEDFSFAPEELASIYLGCSMAQNNRDEIAAIIHRYYPRTEIFVAEKMKRSFALSFRKF